MEVVRGTQRSASGGSWWAALAEDPAGLPEDPPSLSTAGPVASAAGVEALNEALAAFPVPASKSMPETCSHCPAPLEAWLYWSWVSRRPLNGVSLGWLSPGSGTA